MYFVTGATGNIGREVVRLLHTAGHGVRALSRRAAPAGLPDGVEFVRADAQKDSAAVSEALTGVRGVFLNSDATGSATAEFLRMANDRGVAHVVLISSVYVRDGVSAAKQRDEIARMHRRAEEAAESSGLAWTHVRAEEFALNDLLSFLPQLAYGDVVRGPYPSAGSPVVHEHDLAAVAAQALLDGPDIHGGKALVTSGPHVLTEPQRVELLGEVLGRPLRHEEVSAEAGRGHLLAAGIPAAVADAVLTELAVRAQAPAQPTDVVHRLLGRPALSYRQWIQDHLSDLKSAS